MSHTSTIDSDLPCQAIYQGTGSAAEIEAQVDRFYGEAVKRYPTYETMVQSHFCELMRNTFGENEEVNQDVAYAYAYARELYDYLSQDELDKANADAFNKGICSHGLTAKTCPCGCFELE
ncbi:putative regulatory protein [Pseudomonas sp. 8Z]|uniref:hypothetical protein n=1 Tax=Pseudomonas sp. 8Z TaxID=2653166 RepID=UPI0012F0CB28|nr:hypothetical protein [Pseudomonas sp. 8Z]VXC23992.1 putative regulatory protein [Pseudomonas sp. 8Z]